MIDLDIKYLNLIKDIVKKNIDCEIRVFGSRVKSMNAKFSDLDIALVSDSVIDEKILYKIREEISLSDIPIIVDIIDWNTTQEFFQKIILENYEVL